MPYKNKEQRKLYYEKNKEEINKHRREYDNEPNRNQIKRKSEREWRENNKEKVSRWNKISSKKYRDKNRELVFNHYGKKCACCGEKELMFLTIEHINGNGAKHRKEINNKVYEWLIKNNYPRGFEVLCFNCNWGKYRNNGTCPHRKIINNI